jgi:hypothetical protein
MEDPEQWRSAVDQKTSRTYWYHRVTRISRWSKPSFMSSSNESSLENSEKDTSISNDLMRRKTIADNYNYEVANSVDAQRIRIGNILTEPFRMPEDYGGSTESTCEPMGNSIRDSCVIISNAVSCLTSSYEDSRVDALLFLSSKCGTDNEASAQLAYAENLLSNLVIIISRGGSKKCRRLALKVLCSLAICEQSSFVFEDNQSWVIIAHKFLHWEGDKESTLLFCILICCLLTGPARNVIPTETIESVGDLLGFMMDDYLDYSKNGQIDLASLQLISPTPSSPSSSSSSSSTSSSFSPGNWSFLYHLFIAAEGGHDTPALLLLVLLSSAIGSIPSPTDSPSEMETRNGNDLSLVYDILHVGGGASVLQGLCTSTRVTQDVRNRARKLLLEGMAKSTYLRERVLDNFLALSLDHNSSSEEFEERDLERSTDIAVDSDGMRVNIVDGELRSAALRPVQDFLWRYHTTSDLHSI